MSARTPIFAAAALALLAGCGSDPKAASTDNFRAVLQRWYDAHPVCTTLTAMGDVPIVRQASDRIGADRIDAAVAAGLLSVESFQQVPRFARTPAEFRRYTPTEAGRDAIRKDDRGLGGVQLCFARRKIEQVERFTEPGDVAGLHLSRISYRYSFKEIAPWTGHAAIEAAVPAIAATLAKSPVEASDTLILTNEGWTHERGL